MKPRSPRFLFCLSCLLGGWLAVSGPAAAQRSKARAVRPALPDHRVLGAEMTRAQRTALQAADMYFRAEQYAEAAGYYGQLAAAYPDNAYAAFRTAECHRQLFDYAAAEAAYGKVAYADSAAYPLAVFYYGLMQKLNGKYAYSLHSLDAFARQAARLDSVRLPGRHQWLQRAALEQAGCQAALLRERFVQGDFQFRVLGGPVNTPAHDYAPVLLGSDTLLALTSGRVGKGAPADARLGEAHSDLYAFARRDDTTWTADPTQRNPLGTDWSDGAGFLTADGRTFYFTSCQGPGVHCAIFKTVRREGRWSRPEKLNAHVNAPGSDARHPSLTPSGDTLYFASDRPGGYGQNDIWMSRHDARAGWLPAVNAGKAVNTPQNEVSPFYHAAERQFFFASDGRVGMGGLDLYYLDKTGTTALNLGPPFNSSRDDAFLVLGREKGFLASNRTGGPGHFDIHTFSIKSRHSELIALDKAARALQPDLAYLADFQFEYLPQPQKEILSRISAKREAGLLHRIEMPLSSQETAFLKSLSTSEQARAEAMFRTLLARRDSAALQAEDRYQYEYIASEDDRRRIGRRAQAYRAALDGRQDVALAEADQYHYQTLDMAERNRLERQVAAYLSRRLGPGTAGPDEDEYAYAKLSAQEKDRLNRMAAERHAARLNGRDEQFAEADQYFYERLSPEEKTRLDRLVASRLSRFGESLDVSQLSDEDRAFYENLPPEEKARIARLAAARLAAQLNATAERLRHEDQYHYAQLPAEEKNRINRLAAARIAAARQALDGSGLSAEDQFAYAHLTPEERARLDRMAAERHAARLNGRDEQFAEADQYFYERLSPEEKARLGRLMAASAGRRHAAGDSSAKVDDAYAFHSLPYETRRQMVARQGRPQPKRLAPGDPAPEGSAAGTPFPALHAARLGKYKELRLDGRLMDARTGRPAAGFTLPLTDQAGTVLKTTVSNPDGTFRYLGLPVADHLKITIETPSTAFTEAPLLYVEQLEVTAYARGSAPVAFAPALFAFDSHALTPATRRLLDTLAAVLARTPDAQLELNAYTDAAGSDAYNLRLSARRGQAVRTYLTGRGVRPGSIVVFARGEAGAAGPARNPTLRKVTVAVRHAAPATDPAETFVVLPDTDLSAIAEKTGVPVAELRRLNGLQSDVVEPFRPVRVR